MNCLTEQVKTFGQRNCDSWLAYIVLRYILCYIQLDLLERYMQILLTMIN